VALAGYLLTGERQSGGVPQFPESVPDAAAAYVRECLELLRRAGKTPSPGDFIDKFESLLSAPTVDLATRLRGNSVALEEMESVGSVSDFDDDWTGNDAGAEGLEEAISPIKRGIKTHDFNPLQQQKRSAPWGALAAAAVVLLGIGSWIFMGGKSEPAAAVQPVAAASEAEGPAVSKDSPSEPAVKVVEGKPVTTEAAKPQPGSAGVPPAKPAPAVVAAVPNILAAPPIPSAQEREAKPMTKPAAEQPAQAAPTTAAVTSPATAPQSVPAPVAPVTDVKQPTKDPITIRRAIVPSKEEIDRMKQGQVENRTGQMPDIHTASPLPPQRKETP